MGNRLLNIEKVKILLLEHGIKIINTSSYYESLSWPNPNFPKFLNVVLKVKSKKNIFSLFNKFKNIEKKLGRKKTLKNYPRICDIDIIDCSHNNRDVILNEKFLTIPHPRVNERSFVLFPMYEINNKWINPKTKENIVELISKLDFKTISNIKKI